MAEMLTTDEVATLLRVSPDTIRDLVHEGRLHATRVRPRGKMLFREEDVASALQAVGKPTIRASAGG